MLTDDEVDMVVERADGNAFFVEELVGATAGEQGTRDAGLPADLAEVLLVRLDRLDDTARQVVRAASVAGRRVTHDLLAVATDVGDAALDESLRTAVELNILVASDGHYSFRHALLGEAVYDDLLPGERVRLHGKYAAAIGDGRARGTAAELARHARSAHDDDTALKASIQAGDEATPRSAAPTRRPSTTSRRCACWRVWAPPVTAWSTCPAWPSTPPRRSAPAAIPSARRRCWPNSSRPCPTT